MIKLFNTLGRELQEFQPQESSLITFYQCGPTVYWTQHLGNMRAMALSDLMARSLQYLGYEVKFVRNYTDVGHLTDDQDEGEDKMEKGAKREGLTPEEIAQKYIDVFETDLRALNCLNWPETQKPRATQYIKEMQVMVQILLDKGYAYATDLAVYFEVAKFADYTKLSGQDLTRQLAEAGKGEASDPQKKSAADFVLWFFKAGLHAKAIQTWPYQFTLPSGEIISGQGFPGWHLECSVMSKTLLGETLDIHMGGVEHISVHHTNEIAQSEAATGKKFVNYWLHNEHLLVDGGKMSKSIGTSYTLADVKEHGFDPLAVRYFFLQAHYRSKQNFTWEALAAAQTALDKLREQIWELKKAIGSPAEQISYSVAAQNYQRQFVQVISDDFAIPKALAIFWEMLKDNKLSDRERLTLALDFDRVFGLGLADFTKEEKEIPAAVTSLAKEREQARQAKDWQKSDELRERIAQLGYFVKDTNQGSELIAKD